MKIGGFTIFGSMHSNGKPIKSINIISWHPKWSLTWSWTITWSPYYNNGKLPFYYMRYEGYRHRGWFFTCGLNLPILGHINFCNQPTIPFKRHR